MILTITNTSYRIYSKKNLLNIDKTIRFIMEISDAMNHPVIDALNYHVKIIDWQGVEGEIF